MSMIIWPCLFIASFSFTLAHIGIMVLKKYIKNCVDDAKKEIMNELKNNAGE